jgi:hypothetical protein
MLGFVFNRNAVSTDTANYWIECYTCIRKFWPEAPVMIVDSFSDPNYVKEIPLTNCTIVRSEFDGAGYLASYYYFHKLKPFDKAVIIHDSIFIQKAIDFDAVESVKYIWHFTSTLKENYDIEKQMISRLENAEQLDSIYEDTTQWHSCFGCTSIVTWEFINKVKNIFSLVECTKTATDRMCLERVMAVVFTAEEPSLARDPSVLGPMESYIRIGMTWHEYISQYKNCDTPAIKIWTKRA